MERPILIIVHQHNSTPGRVGLELRNRGFALDIRRPRFGDPLPETMDDHAGVVVFGGPMSANDTEDYITREIDWFEVPLKVDAPVLGLCLGAQMLARHLGAEVQFHPEGKVEIGYYSIHPTEAGRALGPWPECVYHWHREGFRLPAGADLLATGEVFCEEAFRYGGNAYGIQFHPEVTLAMMHRWTVVGAPRLELRGARPREQHFAARAVHDGAVREWLERFLDRWTAPLGFTRP